MPAMSSIKEISQQTSQLEYLATNIPGVCLVFIQEFGRHQEEHNFEQIDIAHGYSYNQLFKKLYCRYYSKNL